MSYEWHAEFRLKLEPWDKMEQKAKEELEKRLGRYPKREENKKEARKRAKGELHPVIRGEGSFKPVKKDPYARLQLLSQTVGILADPDRKENEWNTSAKIVYTDATLPKNSDYNQFIKEEGFEYLRCLNLSTPALTETDLALLPANSFFLYIPFTLATPYISKDDEPFYVHENPVRKDHVIRVPLVGSSSWKGTFRAAARWSLKADDKDQRIRRLLGNPKEEKGNFQRGRLSFYPTFFDALEVGVINPHSRETGAGTQPIYIEEVPRGANGVFALLYVPIVPENPKVPLPGLEEIYEDLNLVGQGVYTMLAELGFGAKTGSGMGRAEEDIPGAYLLVHRLVEVSPSLPPPPPGERPPEQFRPDSSKFLDKEGHWLYYKTNEELEEHITGKKARSQYKRQRASLS